MDNLNAEAVLQLIVIAGVALLLWRTKVMSDALDRLRAEVEEAKTAAAGAQALIAGLAEQLRGIADDSAAINQLADDLDASTDSLADAVTANTPQAPVPPAPTAPNPDDDTTGQP